MNYEFRKYIKTNNETKYNCIYYFGWCIQRTDWCSCSLGRTSGWTDGSSWWLDCSFGASATCFSGSMIGWTGSSSWRFDSSCCASAICFSGSMISLVSGWLASATSSSGFFTVEVCPNIFVMFFFDVSGSANVIVAPPYPDLNLRSTISYRFGPGRLNSLKMINTSFWWSFRSKFIAVLIDFRSANFFLNDAGMDDR